MWPKPRNARGEGVVRVDAEGIGLHGGDVVGPRAGDRRGARDVDRVVRVAAERRGTRCRRPAACRRHGPRGARAPAGRGGRGWRACRPRACWPGAPAGRETAGQCAARGSSMMPALPPKLPPMGVGPHHDLSLGNLQRAGEEVADPKGDQAELSISSRPSAPYSAMAAQLHRHGRPAGRKIRLR